MFNSVANGLTPEELASLYSSPPAGDLQKFLKSYHDFYVDTDEAAKSRNLATLIKGTSNDLLVGGIHGFIDVFRKRISADQALIQANLNWMKANPAPMGPPTRIVQNKKASDRVQENQARIDAANHVVSRLQGPAQIEPLGLLFVEKLTMTPSQYERGDLVYSLPLAPKEKVTLSHGVADRVRGVRAVGRGFARTVQRTRGDFRDGALLVDDR
jgi:hypothetical protein